MLQCHPVTQAQVLHDLAETSFVILHLLFYAAKTPPKSALRIRYDSMCHKPPEGAYPAIRNKYSHLRQQTGILSSPAFNHTLTH
jgi:hypothetical protein